VQATTSAFRTLSQVGVGIFDLRFVIGNLNPNQFQITNYKLPNYKFSCAAEAAS
jgi:hypothetical protein